MTIELHLLLFNRSDWTCNIKLTWDVAKLLAFLQATQPETVAALGLDEDGPKRLSFLHRL